MVHPIAAAVVPNGGPIPPPDVAPVSTVQVVIDQVLRLVDSDSD